MIFSYSALAEHCKSRENETPDQHKTRLVREREYKQQKKSKENTEEREMCILHAIENESI
ncbi:17642_t:CDS:2 [Acaulospora morrowiae]|uniref:17642_t:CDS:1 n=1 Tax=Acaulospora morrowiae TaxID=94023 RepID=A0A9N8V8N1_9GLOM|nr:17642_t:CDS:2 [Acaulospora morrowiae]